MERIYNGILEVRMRKGNWVPKHIWVWEMEHGPVPKGSTIEFVDGNNLNCVLSNLKLSKK